MRILILATICLTIIISCKKELKPDQGKQLEEIATVMPPTSNEKHDMYMQLAEIIMKTAKYNVDFKKHVYSECYQEYQGDTYVRVQDLINYNTENENIFWGSEENDALQGIVNSIRDEDPEEPFEPVLFVPFIEEIIENENLEEFLAVCPEDLPIGVIGSEYDNQSQECPAYTLDANDGLVGGGYHIDEARAWEDEVWVFIQEENIETGMGEAIDYEEITADRYDGIAEYGGIIQVIDMGALEPWVSGKFEFKYFVFNHTGVKIKEREFPPTKRKKLRNEAWVDYDDFIANWNISNIGNWMIESWIELDGGNETVTVSQTLPAPCAGCPSTTISHSRLKRDDEMGQSLIQFTDNYETAYGITAANIKRKTR